MTKKKIILIIIAAIVVIFIVYQAFLKPKELDFTTETITRGEVLQEVSESGTVEKGENINLNFKTGGKIEAIYVKVGDMVLAGQSLAKLDMSQLSIQLAQAEITAEAQMARLLELQRSANSDLDKYYENTSAVLNQSYNLADSVIRQQIADMFIYRLEFADSQYELTYKNCNIQATEESIVLRKTAEDNLNIWRDEIKNLSDNPVDLENAILKAETSLNSFRSLLLRLNDTLNITCQLELEERSEIEVYKPIVNLALTNLNTVITSISTQKNTIEAQKLAVQNYSTQDQQEITYQEGLVKQTQASVDLLKKQIQDTFLRSPIDGQIANVNKREGESILITEPLFTLLPDSPFQIKVNIYEEDIVKVKIGDPTDIQLTAFPGQIFEGHIVSTDPSSKLINGVVYFGTNIGLQNLPKGVRSGMSADVQIKTEQRKNVLIIPDAALEKRDGKIFVQVVKENKIETEERKIETGLEGTDGTTEILSGLQEGEAIAIPK
ncbi:efflux RND transporter periplasmic adaptor subunit [Patescibacteria group bacterium]